ncbi:MAG: proprotein convertase P-domain-containing protein, partial [Planctomycetales bacterium]|nr:proprotein convertase P-domain-containing protein [Planctomycetales bacterium]
MSHKSTSRKSQHTRQHGLRVEPLERREMLSVDPSWLNTFEGAVTVNDVAVASNGDAVVTGSFGDAFDFDLGPGANVLTPTTAGQSDGFVARYASADGALVWAKQFTGGTFAAGNSLAIDVSGDVLLAGTFRDGSLDINADGIGDAPNAGGTDTFVARFDVGGSVSLLTHVGGDGFDGAPQLAPDGAGNVNLLGESSSTSLTFGPQSVVRSGAVMTYLAQLDTSGAVQWARQLDGQSSADEVLAQALTIAPDGSPLLAVRYSGSADLGLDSAGQAIVKAQVNIDDTHDGIIVRYDSSGNLDWAYAVDGAVKDVAVDAALNVYGAGNFRGVNDFDPLNTHPGDADILTSIDGSRDAMVLKLNANGAFQQVAAFGGAGEDGADARIARSDNGRLFIAGPFADQVSFGGQTLAAVGNEDAFVVELDESLAVRNALRLGSASIQDLALDSSSNLLLIGRFQDGADLPTGEVLAGSSDYLYKSDPDVRTITGRVFADLDGDGLDDDSNRAIGDDWTVFLDANGNGQRDAGEAFTTTIGSSGAFSFPNVAPGTYVVVQELPAGWTQTAPIDGGGLPVNAIVTVSELTPSPYVSFGASAPTSTTTFVSADTPMKVNNTLVTSTLVVDDGNHGAIADINIQVHFPKVNDQGKTVGLYLISPSGTRVKLLRKNFRPDGLEMVNTVFDDEAALSASEGSAPFLGSFRPVEPLSTFDSEDAAGEWTLEIEWIWSGKPDRLESWSLDITRFSTPQPHQAPTIASLTAAPSPVVQGD